MTELVHVWLRSGDLTYDARVEMTPLPPPHRARYRLYLTDREFKLYDRIAAVVLARLIEAYPLPLRYTDFSEYTYARNVVRGDPRGSLVCVVTKLRDTMRTEFIPLEVLNVHNFGYLLYLPDAEVELPVKPPMYDEKQRTVLA